MTHICVSKLTIIGSDNGLTPGRRQAIIWTNVRILLIGPLGRNFSENLIQIQTFSFKKMHLKMSSVKRRPFWLGLNVLSHEHGCQDLDLSLQWPAHTISILTLLYNTDTFFIINKIVTLSWICIEMCYWIYNSWQVNNELGKFLHMPIPGVRNNILHNYIHSIFSKCYQLTPLGLVLHMYVSSETALPSLVTLMHWKALWETGKLKPWHKNDLKRLIEFHTFGTWKLFSNS